MATQNRNFVILGATLIQLALGAIYAWPVFTPVLRNADWSKTETQIVFAVGLAMFALSMIFAGKKMKSWGPQKLSVLGGIVLGAGYLAAGLFGATDFITLLICIGVIGGIGIGLAYVVPIAVGIQWFPNKKGMITGIAVAGFGFGALLWVKLAGSWGDLLGSMGIANTFMLYGALFLLMILVGSLWMKNPPAGWEPAGGIKKGASKQTAEVAIEMSSKAMLRTPQFYMIFLTFAFSAGAGLMSIGLMKLYPMEALMQNGFSELKASAIAGTAIAVFFSLANGLGRILWGIISDALGRRKSIIILTLTQGIFVILFTYMAGSELLLYLAATLIGFNYGGLFALFPAITADVFGSKSVGQNYPYVFLAYGFGGIFGPVLGGYLGDLGNFPAAFTISGVLVLLSTLLIYFVKNVKEARA